MTKREDAALVREIARYLEGEEGWASGWPDELRALAGRLEAEAEPITQQDLIDSLMEVNTNTSAANIKLADERDRLHSRLARFEEALIKIRDDPHCAYFHEEVGGGTYGTGVSDGHRCAANKAAAALLAEGERP